MNCGKKERKSNKCCQDKKMKVPFSMVHAKDIVVLMLVVLILPSFLIILYIANKSEIEEVSSVLALMSLVTSLSFEIHEWTFLSHKKDRSTKVLTAPCIIIFSALLLLCLIYNFVDVSFSNKKANFLCALTLNVYILLVAIRGIKENKRR